MDAIQFGQLQDLFDRLCELPAADQRDLIERDAQDPALRAELERLLAVHRDLEAAPAIAPPPQRIGPYHILAELGHGGMGTVYKAEQLEPVRRLLAIKVVQAGLGTKEVLARFHVERKALAAMNHRHIAKVFDAGATEQGQPYFAMELVEGLPLGEYCDRHRLSLPQRLRLFQQICDGVQHAHQKGVVHRDLKPGNVLVATEGQEPVPKIVDFGLAKATDRDFVDVSLMTAKDQVLGTFEYMSPEQAHGDSDLVDARADIYSLGVMLYELLCGELPFPTDLLRKSGRLDALRMIREQEPAKPSAKLLARADRETVAARRQTSVKALHQALRGDLDWIVLAAMAKEPERRYAAATLLAADLQRHLDFEPVLASPPSLGYRVRKFVRRYRVQCVAAAVVCLAIVSGGIGTWMGLAAERAESERNRVFADVARLADARAREERLYPAWPDQIPAMQGWLATHGEPMANRLQELDAALANLRARARPRTSDPAQAALDATTRNQLQSDLDQEDIEPRRIELAEQIRRLDTAAEARAFEFADDHDAFVHRTLTQLVHELRDFVAADGPLARVRARLEAAARLREDTVLAHRARWDEAIAAIAASDGVTASAKYDHLVLAPQLGLVPLGMDPASKLWDFVHPASGAPGGAIPLRDPVSGRLLVTGDTGVVFVLLPSGMLPVEDGGAPEPRHALRLDAFFLSKYELTQGQMLRLARQSMDRRAQENLVMPATWLSWFDSRDLLAHEAWQLPTMMQWEYGCRAGTTTPWWTGASPESLAGNESPPATCSMSAIGSLAANPFGLFDTLGNAWEWCRDELATEGAVATERAGDGLRIPRGLATNAVHQGAANLLLTNNAPAGRFNPLSASTRFTWLGVRPTRAVFP